MPPLLFEVMMKQLERMRRENKILRELLGRWLDYVNHCLEPCQESDDQLVEDTMIALNQKREFDTDGCE